MAYFPIQKEIPTLSGGGAQSGSTELILQRDIANVYDIRASHQEGEMCPTFRVSCVPDTNEDTLTPFSTKLWVNPYDWQPPATVTFAIGFDTWECALLESTQSVQGQRIACTATYIPTPLYILRFARSSRYVAWLSCPDWQKDLLEQQFGDSDDYLFYHKSADVYASNGWTVGDIFVAAGALFGVEIVNELPDLHVPQPSVVLAKDQIVSSFLSSLLPSGFRYIWDTRDGKLVVGLAEPAEATLEIPPYASNADITQQEALTYDRITITGAPMKKTAAIDLDDNLIRPGASSTSSQAGVIVTESDPPVTSTDDAGYTITVNRIRQIQMGPDGTPFAVLREEETMIGPLFNAKNVYAGNGVTSRRVTVNTYENNDANIYLEPRLISSTTTVDGYAPFYSTSPISSGMGNVFYLLDSYDVVTYADYAASLVDGRAGPVIIMSASMMWTTSKEVITETKTYIHAPDEVTVKWPEGYETLNVQTTRGGWIVVNGTYYAILDDPAAVLRQIGIQLQYSGATSITSSSSLPRSVQSISTRQVKMETTGAYQYHEHVRAFSVSQQAWIERTSVTRISSTPPQAPTRYRTYPLKAVLHKTSGLGGTGDGSGFGKSFERTGLGLSDLASYAASGRVPTANTRDFAYWAGVLFKTLTMPQQRMVSTIHGYLVPQGGRIGGGTVVSWDISQQGQQHTVTITTI